MVLVPPMTGGHTALPGELRILPGNYTQGLPQDPALPCASPNSPGEVPDSTSQTAHAKPDSKLLELSFQFTSCRGKIMALIMGIVQLSQTKQLVFLRAK